MRFTEREKLIEQTEKETAKIILQMIKENCSSFSWTSSIDYTYNLIAERFGVKVK